MGKSEKKIVKNREKKIRQIARMSKSKK